MIHVHVYYVGPMYADLDIDTEDPEEARRKAIEQAQLYRAHANPILSTKLRETESEFIAVIQRKGEKHE
jgi:hypothetical protein